MDAIPALFFDGRCSCEVGCLLESSDKFGPAVGIAAVIGGIDADKDIEYSQYLGPGKGIAQEYSIACRDLSYRDSGRVVYIGSVLGYINSPIG
jgi:hypothetical protein